MKKLFYSLFAITMAVFSFTSCEDVPEPYNIPEKPGTGGDGGEEELQGSGSGKLLDPYDCIAAINYCKLLGENVESAENVYVKGIISKIKEVDTGSHGNASFYISNDGSTNNEFYVYHAYYLGNKKYTSADQIKEGDEVIIYGKVVNYVSNYGSTPETSGGKAYIYSLNGVTEDAGGDEPNVPGEGEYINESFGSSFGSFTVKTVKGTAWIIDYSSAKATGYDNSSKISTPSDSYIVSNAIDLSKSTGAYITFSYILRYFTNNGDAKPGVKDEVLITDNYTGDPSTTKWTDISGKLTEGSDWSTWYTYSMDIPAEFISKSNVVIALHYTCENNSATWEVKNLVVKEGKAEQGGTDEPGGGDEPGGEVGDGMTVSSLISGQVGDIVLTENSYGSQNVSNESTWYSWKYDNVTYQGAKVCKANGNFTGCIQVQGNASDTAKQGFFFNKTAFANDIKTITLVVKGDAKFDSPTEYGVYAGTEAHPVSSAITATTSTSKGETLNTYTMVYDFSGGSYKYFTVWNNKVGALYIEKIVITLK